MLASINIVRLALFKLCNKWQKGPPQRPIVKEYGHTAILFLPFLCTSHDNPFRKGKYSTITLMYALSSMHMYYSTYTCMYVIQARANLSS